MVEEPKPINKSVKEMKLAEDEIELEE